MSAESVEVRLTKLEADMRRVESVSEPRFARIEEALKGMATKADLAEGFGSLRAEMHKELGGLRSEMRAEYGGLRTEMHKEFTAFAEKMAAQTNRFIAYTLAFISFAVSLAVAVSRLLQP